MVAMNSDDLRFFALVVESGSLAAAALASGCDASTISRRVTQLERSVGTRLLSRSGRGVGLTPQGQELLKYAREVNALMDSAMVALSQVTREGPASVRIAAQPTIAKALFASLFHAIRSRFPSCEIHFVEGLGMRVLADLQAGHVDMAVLYRPEHPGSLALEPLLYEKLYVLTPMDSDVTATQVREHGLRDIPLILPSTHHGLRLLVQSLCARRGLAPTIALQSDSSTATTLELVAKGCGCTVKPLAAAEADIAAGRMRAFPLEDEGAERCIALVLGKTEIAPSHLWALSGIVRETALRLAKSQAWSGTRAAQ